MNKIVFLKNINEYVKQKSLKIKLKKLDIQKLNIQLQIKEQQVNLQEQEFEQSFDEGILINLKDLKSEIASIKKDIENIKKAIDIMTITVDFQYDSEKLENEIDQYIEGLRIEVLKKNVEDAKAKYMESLEIYTNQMGLLDNCINKFGEIKEIISEDNKKTIYETFSKPRNYFYWYYPDFGVNQHEIEEISCKNNKLTFNIYKSFKKDE